MIGQTWKDLTPEIITNGFRKGGIHPFNRQVIPDDKYHPECLKRWKQRTVQEPLRPPTVNESQEANPRTDVERSKKTGELKI